MKRKVTNTTVVPASAGTRIKYIYPTEPDVIVTKTVVAWAIDTVEHTYADETVTRYISTPITPDWWGIKIFDYVGEPDAPYVVVDPARPTVVTCGSMGIVVAHEPDAIRKHLTQELKDFGLDWVENEGGVA